VRHARRADRRRARDAENPCEAKEVLVMAVCETCGNDYDKAFQVMMDGETHVFDSFECAIHSLAPVCGHFGCRIIGHGVESGGEIFCCANCAKNVGVTGIVDRA
jgi:hypothetical protein